MMGRNFHVIFARLRPENCSLMALYRMHIGLEKGKSNIPRFETLIIEKALLLVAKKV